MKPLRLLPRSSVLHPLTEALMGFHHVHGRTMCAMGVGSVTMCVVKKIKRERMMASGHVHRHLSEGTEIGKASSFFMITGQTAVGLAT